MSRDVDRERIQERWDELFDVASAGYSERGRGGVIVRGWDAEPWFASLRDIPGAEANPNLAKAVGSYDPASEIVVVVLGEGATIAAVYELRRRLR